MMRCAVTALPWFLNSWLWIQVLVFQIRSWANCLHINCHLFWCKGLLVWTNKKYLRAKIRFIFYQPSYYQTCSGCRCWSRSRRSTCGRGSSGSTWTTSTTRSSVTSSRLHTRASSPSSTRLVSVSARSPTRSVSTLYFDYIPESCVSCHCIGGI